MVEIKIKKLRPSVIIPTKATSGSACYDIYSVEEATFSPMETALMSSGLKFELPEGYAMDIRPRSGLASKGLIILNSPGTLDSDYRGELRISFMNLSEYAIKIKKGDRIAQIRLIKEIRIEFKEGILSKTEREEGGFGSTGK